MSTATERLTRPTKPRGAVLAPAPPNLPTQERIARAAAASAEDAARRRREAEASRTSNRRIARALLLVGFAVALAVMVAALRQWRIGL